MSRVFDHWVGRTTRIVVLVLLSATQIVGCTDDLSGPGTFLVVVSPSDGSVPGAVVVELLGGEFTSVSGVGATETFIAEPSDGGAEMGPLRVVVVGSGEPLAFEVQVADAAKGAPSGVVVQAADLDNVLVPADRYWIAMHLGR